MDKRKYDYRSGIFYLSLSVVISVLGIIAPQLLFFTSVFSLAFAVSAFLFLPYYPALLASLLVFGISLALKQNFYMAALYSGLFLPVAAGISYCIKRKKNMITTFMTGLILSSVLMITDLCLYIYIRGGELSESGMKVAFRPFTDEFVKYYNSFVEIYKNMNPAKGGQTEAFLSEFLNVLGKALTASLAAIIISFLIIIVFIAILIAKRVLYKKGLDVSSLKRFRDFSLPKSASVLFLICLIGQLFANGFILTAVINLYSVLSLMFLISGLSFLSFMLNRAEINKLAIKVIFISIIFACMLPVGFSTIVSGAGVLDSLSDIRKRFLKKG